MKGVWVAIAWQAGNKVFAGNDGPLVYMGDEDIGLKQVSIKGQAVRTG